MRLLRTSPLILIILIILAGLPSEVFSQPEFQSHVRPTEPLTPQQQLQTFRLPAGFEIQLFASEPQLQKPMNMAFDARGRLWVSGSIEYPYAARDGQGRDTVRVLEDTDGDGSADKITTFADGLNIPIGLYPYRDGVIVYSIPDILFLRDTDGDGRADQREVLFGPLGHPRDTHGMQNAFRRGFDGWIYICHGFNNDTILRGKDGSEIRLNSGNTYRIRPDGSRVEQFTWGQVNPFGSTWTPWGDLITADCHSKPLTLLLRGGHYSSFGKPHDGLGHVPSMMEHGHGSTAIAGAVYVSDARWPDEYQGNLLVGNVMTSRINRDNLQRIGSTIRAQEASDFLECGDPWFRPVDMQLGPDGALYVADFYNRIIGHYEVPLDHPGRDRTSGRIWRIIPTGDPSAAKPDMPVDLAAASTADLIRALEHSNLTVRQLATDQLTDRVGSDAVIELEAVISQSSSNPAVLHALWALHRIAPERITDDMLLELARRRQDDLTVHLMRLIAEQTVWSDERRTLCLQALTQGSPHVQRTAADAFSVHSEADVAGELLDALIKTPASDALLDHMLRIALRNQLRIDGRLTRLAGQPLSREARKRLTSICLGLKNEESGRFLVEYLKDASTELSETQGLLAHAAAHLPVDQVEELALLIQSRLTDQPDAQLALIDSIRGSLTRRGQPLPDGLRSWSRRLADQLLKSLSVEALTWGVAAGENPWGLERRNCEDGQQGVVFLSSLPGGEKVTSVLKSRSFPVPRKLSFFLCGHLGFPNDPARNDNLVRLVLDADNRVIQTALPPRNDTARQIVWELGKYQGQTAHLEIVDGIDLSAYAWLAVARFEPDVVQIPSVSPSQTGKRIESAARLIRDMQLPELVPVLRELLTQTQIGWPARHAVAGALLSFDQTDMRPALGELIGESDVSEPLREQICQLLATDSSDESVQSLLLAAMKSIPLVRQRQVASVLVSSSGGSRRLMELVKAGAASPRLIQDPGLTDRMLVALGPDARAELETLTADFPDLNRELDQLIAVRRQAFAGHDASLAVGRELFRKHCSACHQIQGQGGLIAPQLDGIGARGPDRIIEDILDPNRNVDKAFHTTIVALTSGKVVSGLARRRDGNALILANTKGEEFAVLEAEIDESRTSAVSIMPPNFTEVLSEPDFLNLVAYLASLKAAPPTDVKWTVTRVDDRFRAEGIAVADVNQDGQLDLMSGEFWYEAPNWIRHEIAPPGDYGDGAGGYSNAFACFSDDINQDGWTDYIVVGFPGAACHWFENPRNQPGHWKKHRIWHSACNETPIYVDLLGNGQRALVMGWQPEGQDNQGQMAWFAPGKDPTALWTMHPISRPSQPGQPVPGTHRFAHGLGAGDVNSDGRTDVLCTGGWWEQPTTDALSQPWRFHAVELGPACANMAVHDVNRDGVPDVIASSAHGFGIWWHEQSSSGEFTRHDLFPDLVSQTHALETTDINGDGVMDFITGKRFWAHGPNGDPGRDQPAMLFWFEGVESANSPTRYIPRAIHQDSGMGTQFTVVDLNGDQRPDIVTSNKKGVWIFVQNR